MGDNSINTQLGKEKLGVNGISLWFTLPPNTKIVSGGFTDPAIRTQERCQVNLHLTQTELRVYISPALIIDPFMASEYGLQGLTYRFMAQPLPTPAHLLPPALPARSTISCHQPQTNRNTFDFPDRKDKSPGLYKFFEKERQPSELRPKPLRPDEAKAITDWLKGQTQQSQTQPVVTLPEFSGEITDVSLYAASWYNPIRPTETVKEKIRDAFMQMIRNTRYTKPNYLPLNDPDPMGGLNEIKANMSGSPNTMTVNLALAQIGNIGGGINLTTQAPIIRNAGGGGIEIPAGANINVEIQLMGNAQDVTHKFVGLSRMILSSDKIYLVKGGEKIVRLKSLVMKRGGEIEVLDYEGMGALATAEGFEALVKLFLVAATQDARAAGIKGPVERIADRELHDELQKAIRDVYLQNYDTLQNAVRPFSLPLFFGMDRNGRTSEFPTKIDYSTHEKRPFLQITPRAHPF